MKKLLLFCFLFLSTACTTVDLYVVKHYDYSKLSYEQRVQYQALLHEANLQNRTNIINGRTIKVNAIYLEIK